MAEESYTENLSVHRQITRREQIMASRQLARDNFCWENLIFPIKQIANQVQAGGCPATTNAQAEVEAE